MQRKLTKLSVLSTLSILAIAGLGQSSLSTQLVQEQKVIQDSSIYLSTMAEDRVFQPNSQAV